MMEGKGRVDKDMKRRSCILCHIADIELVSSRFCPHCED